MSLGPQIINNPICRPSIDWLLERIPDVGWKWLLEKAIIWCWNEAMNYAQLLLFLSLLLSISSAFYDSYVHKKKYRVYLWIYSAALWAICYYLQYTIRSPRPYPECVNSMCRKYGFPESDIVGVTSSMVIVFFFGFISKRSSGDWFLKVTNYGIAVFFLFIYPFAYWWFYLNTFVQVVLSMAIGIGSSATMCMSIKMYDETIFEKIHNVKKQRV